MLYRAVPLQPKLNYLGFAVMICAGCAPPLALFIKSWAGMRIIRRFPLTLRNSLWFDVLYLLDITWRFDSPFSAQSMHSTDDNLALLAENVRSFGSARDSARQRPIFGSARPSWHRTMRAVCNCYISPWHMIRVEKRETVATTGWRNHRVYHIMKLAEWHNGHKSEGV